MPQVMRKADQVLPPENTTNDLICKLNLAKLRITSSINPTEDNDEKVNPKTVKLPEGIELLNNQVAGHGDKDNTIGMLKYNDFVLKPIEKKEKGDNEIYFYRTLEDSVDPAVLIMRELVPKFHGVKVVVINDRPVDCIVLEDITQNFDEPCVMDIKIGRRTWGPLASQKKIMHEQTKYYESKRDLGFCIPGFQVYDMSTNTLRRFDKTYCKKMNKNSSIDAIKKFLNADHGFCRSLLMQLLASLWRIQHWARTQRHVCLYSSSIILAYDARRLKEFWLKNTSNPLKLKRKNSLYRPLSLTVLHNASEKIQTGFSGQLTKEGPILRRPTSSKKHIGFELPAIVNNNNTWQKSMRTLKRTHSFQNNYDKDMESKKQDYSHILDDLCQSNRSEIWATVKMIDFANVHHTQKATVDKNYLEGIDTLVKLFEDWLYESE